MLVSRLRQRLAIPTVLVRAIGVYAALFLLLVLLVGCGGQSSTADSKTDKAKAEKQKSTDKTEKQEKTTTPEPPLALFPLGEVRREGADPGWQKASVEFGIRNDGSTPKDIQFPKGPGEGKGKGPSGGKDKGPGGGEGTISVEEGRTYDVKSSHQTVLVRSSEGGE